MASDASFALLNKLLSHPMLSASARALRLNKTHFFGHITSLFMGAYENADDGDLWRGSEDSTRRFIAALADFPGDSRKAAEFVDVLQKDGWLNEWLIQGWVDFVGPALVNRYKTSGRERLAAIWQLHDRQYGRAAESTENGTEAERKCYGSSTEVARKSVCHPQPYNPKPSTLKTLNPQTLDQKETNNPKGGVGENEPPKPQGFLSSSDQGFRVQGAGLPTRLPPEAYSDEDIFSAFAGLLRFHSIHSLTELTGRVKHCNTTVAGWVMLFLDKVHYAYQEKDGVIPIESEDSVDPVAMTIAALSPQSTRRHVPTDGARSFFSDVMLDYAMDKVGAASHWKGKVSGPAVAVELARRKGKRSRARA